MSELAIPWSDPEKQRYFTPQSLHEAVEDGIRRGFNRCLEWSEVEKVIQGRDTFPSYMMMTHHHVAGRPAPIHYRVFVQLGSKRDEVAIMDIAPELWDRLPVAAVRLDGCKADLKKGDC